jgi:hypothetical protein
VVTVPLPVVVDGDEPRRPRAILAEVEEESALELLGRRLEAQTRSVREVVDGLGYARRG